ncbi:MAG: polysaccharide biosynthesis/export family protein [Oceanospirillaceae bacterium]|nr:polysaccharide biosynthesis/export family protein [Oceanospirillaceae bacterium]
MQNCHKIIALLCCAISLSACSLTPGSHFPPKGDANTANTAQLKKDLSSANIHVIDSVLLTKQNKARQQALNISRQGAFFSPDNSHYQYKIGIADVLAVGVWDHPELTIAAGLQRTSQFDGFRVQSDGTFNFAYASNLKAAGQTINQIRHSLIGRLSRVIEKPQVDVKVIGFNSQKVYVTGEIKRPGIFPITDVPLTLIDAINLAGGLTEKANWRSLTFSRDHKSETIRLDNFYRNGDVSQNRLLKHGDVIHVERNDTEKVFVLGDIQSPGTIEVSRYGLTLAEALTESGGINEHTANANGIFVFRMHDKLEEGVLVDVYQLYAKNVTAFILADQFQLQPHDIVYVTTAPLARWNRLISQLIPTVDDANIIYDLKSNSGLF